MTSRTHLVPALLLLTSLCPGQSPPEFGAALSLQPQGAHSAPILAGANPPKWTGDIITFEYLGPDETVIYEVNLGDQEVQDGLIRIREVTSNSYPIANGGLTWRRLAGVPAGTYQPIDDPVIHSMAATNVRLVHAHIDPSDHLKLVYEETRDDTSGVSVTAHKTYEFWLVGKVLKLRVSGSRDDGSPYLDNYGGFRAMSSEGTTDAREQHIPYMDNVPVVGFTKNATNYFFSVYQDWYRSSLTRSSSTVYSYSTPYAPTNESIEHYYGASTMNDENGDVLKSVDETINIIVTQFPHDIFPVPPNYRSPYFEATAGRMHFFGIGGFVLRSHYGLQSQFEFIKELGIADVAITQHGNWTYAPGPVMIPNVGRPSIMGCRPEDITTDPVVTDSQTAVEYHPVDPDNSSNILLVDTEFGALSDAARATGAFYAHTTVHNGLDPWGAAPAEHICPGQVQPGTVGYRLDVPRHHAPEDVYTIPVSPPQIPVAEIRLLGLKFPVRNTSYSPEFQNTVVRDVDGNGKGGIDTSTKFQPEVPGSPPTPASTFRGWGLLQQRVGANHAMPILEAQLNYGVNRFEPNAAAWDAAHHLPSELAFDQRATSNNVRSIGEILAHQAATLRELREYIGGPIYGEAAATRSTQWYEYGLRDGTPGEWPPSDIAGEHDWSDSWVIPDFQLLQAKRKASATYGMGQEEEFHHGPGGDRNGDTHAFKDDWITSCAAFGNGPKVTSAGHNKGTLWTYQGILTMYSILAGIDRAQDLSTVSTIYYVDKSDPDNKLELGEALLASWDADYFRYPRIETTFDSGLVVFSNHGMAAIDGGLGTSVISRWTVDVPLPGGGTQSVELEPNGFAAGDGSSILVIFNGRPTNATPNIPEPFDYAWVEDRWEAINYRQGDDPLQEEPAFTYRNFPPDLYALGIFSKEDYNEYSEGFIMHSLLMNSYVGANGGKWDLIAGEWHIGNVTIAPNSIHVPGASPTPPTATSLEIRSQATALFVDKPEGFVAIASYDNGSWRDVTTLVDWTVSGPAQVDQSGAVTCTDPGSVTVTATFQGLSGSSNTFSVQHSLTADAGADVTNVKAGKVISFDGSGSADAKGGNLAYSWDFGDGTEPGTGVRPSHVYTFPGPYTVTLTIKDIEENVATDTVLVTFDGSPRLAGHDFEDGDTDSFSQFGGTWGVINGDLDQLDSTGTNAVVLVDPSTGVEQVFDDASARTHVEILNGTGSVSLHMRTGPGNPTTADGYTVTFGQDPTQVEGERGTLVLTKTEGGVTSQLSQVISPFDERVSHNLKISSVVTDPVFWSTANPERRLAVIVDGVLEIDTRVLDTIPPGRCGLSTSNAEGSFRHIFVDQL